MISVESLKVEFGVKPLFSGVSFVINERDRIALVGKNGAGKSTILKSITRQIKTLGGNVSIADERIDAMENAILARKMAVVLTERMKNQTGTIAPIVGHGWTMYDARRN
mgnify:CR=1 FL=1